jgi:PDZ domain-containing protein
VSPNGRGRRYRPTKLIFLIPVLALAYVGYVVRLPYFVVGPGPASDVEPLIHIQGHTTYQSNGHLLLTAVSFYQPNVYEAFGAWLSPSEAVVPEHDILAPGQTQQQENRQALAQMLNSQIDAEIVALTRFAGYPKDHGTGVLVENVGDGTPAAARLSPGDVIVKVNGQTATGVDQVSRAIRSAGVGRPVHFTILSGGKTQDVAVAPIMVPNVDHPIIGVNLVENLPFSITINSDGIGGPSAGLMWTLGLIDVLTPGDLTGGRTIAGTGTIALDGTVGPIGGIEQKVVAAERAGAKVFFAPSSEAPAARAVVHGMIVVPVKTLQDALTYLGLHG